MKLFATVIMCLFQELSVMVRLICTLLLLGRLGGEVAEEHVRSLPLLKWLHPVIDACRGWLPVRVSGTAKPWSTKQ